MLTLITISICLFLIFVTGWTLTTYFIKKDSQNLIRKELKNLFDVCKMLVISLKTLIEILASSSFSSESEEVNAVETTISDEDEQLLSLVHPVQKIESASLEVVQEEDDDTALSSFSPEVVDVINEEEEKVA
tara:strand:- start:421 stop:816 length:396 start_codon:yes stop_codon:yes gene_type:complete